MEIPAIKFNPFYFFDYKKLAWKEYIELNFCHFKSKLSFLIKNRRKCDISRIQRETVNAYSKCINRQSEKDSI